MPFTVTAARRLEVLCIDAGRQRGLGLEPRSAGQSAPARGLPCCGLTRDDWQEILVRGFAKWLGMRVACRVA